MRVWVDCTAAAHPLVLRPIIERLEAGGHEVAVTARDYGQTLGLLERLGIPYEAVGRARRSGGWSGKASGAGPAQLRARALGATAALRPRARATARSTSPSSRALLRIPLVQMQDYEHAGLQRQLAFRAARRVLVPDAIPLEAMRRAGAAPRKLFRYPGLKEDYYLFDFTPDRGGAGRARARPRAGAGGRPPAAGDLRLPRAKPALRRGDRAARRGPGHASAVVIPSTEAQGAAIRARDDPSLIVPDEAVDAQSLIAYADLVVSAGGTMNREAVALGTPVYTIFSGRMGARRRAPDRRPAPCASSPTRPSSSCESATARRACSTRATRSCSPTRSSERW